MARVQDLDPAEIERLGDLVVRSGTVRVVSADTMQPLMTTTEILDIEDRLAVDARALATTPSGLNPERRKPRGSPVRRARNDNAGYGFHPLV